jgi:hypothetical protein
MCGSCPWWSARPDAIVGTAMTEVDIASMTCRRTLARRLDALLIATTSGPYGSGRRVSDLGREPAVRRIRMLLVDESLVLPASTLDHVASFIAHPATDAAARLAAELDRQRPDE